MITRREERDREGGTGRRKEGEGVSAMGEKEEKGCLLIYSKRQQACLSLCGIKARSLGRQGEPNQCDTTLCRSDASYGWEQGGNQVLNRFDWCASIETDTEGRNGCDTSMISTVLCQNHRCNIIPQLLYLPPTSYISHFYNFHFVSLKLCVCVCVCAL